MTANSSSSQQWEIGPLRLWLRAHHHGQRGETQARSVLSTVLGEENVHIERDERGRPQLAGNVAHYDANWSHSGDWLLVALGESIEVGVDIELIRPRPRAMEIAERFFHADETTWLRRLPADQQESTFVRVWCAKEAILKAHGHGISFGLEKFQIGEREGGLYLRSCDPRLGQAEDWQLHEWVPVDGYRAVVAWRSAPSAIMGV